ncbi:MAG TPA: HK97 family phage prohead protease [Planctomycetaceae bacterium]|nr:HK97 family phage prohead protease [Planctomycetaceae bacterium]
MTAEQRGHQGIVEIHEERAIRGYAAVYYDGTAKTEFSLTPTMVERIHPGAFDDVLAGQTDILALYHHDDSQLLGRRSAQTLELVNEKRGLAYSVPYDSSDPIHQTVAARIRRKDVSGSSFTFNIGEEKFERRSDGKVIRNIHRFASVLDVGPTHLPTYSGTSAEFRSATTLEDYARQQLGIEPPTPVEFLLRSGR